MFGEQPMRVDFVVDADEQYHFSIYRTMFVGSGNITIDFKTHLDKDGILVVEQTMTNSAQQPVDFKCFLYAKGYRRQRAQVYRLGSTPGPHCVPLSQRQSTLGQRVDARSGRNRRRAGVEIPLHRRSINRRRRDATRRRKAGGKRSPNSCTTITRAVGRDNA